MSLHHAVGMRLVAGGNDPVHYAQFESGLDVADAASRVTVHVDEDADSAFPDRLLAAVTVTTNDAEYTVASEAPGTPATPMDREARLAKFHSLADPVIGEIGASRLIDAVDALPDGGNVSAVLPLTRKQHTR